MLVPDHRQAAHFRGLGERRQRQFYMAVHPATQKARATGIPNRRYAKGRAPGFGSMKGRGYNSVSIHGRGFPPELWKLAEKLQEHTFKMGTYWQFFHFALDGVLVRE